jgi:hypothetical protein
LENGSEIIATTSAYDFYTFDIYVWRNNGDVLPGWPKTEIKSMATPAVGDINGDGANEIVVGLLRDSSNMLRVGSTMYAFKADGSDVPGWPFVLPQTDEYDGFSVSPVLADLDKDGKLEIISNTQNGLVYIWRYDGSVMAGWPQPMQVEHRSNYANSSPAVADLDGDGYLDVIAVDKNKLYAWKKDGQLLSGFPLEAGLSVATCSPTVADINNDDKLEIALCDRMGKVSVWTMPWESKADKMPWPMFHQNLQHTGVYMPPNRAPVFEALYDDVQVVNEGEDWHIDLVNEFHPSDPDGDSLAFYLKPEETPINFNITPEGVLSWAPNFEQGRDVAYSIPVYVTDRPSHPTDRENALEASHHISVKIVDVNRLPEITTDPETVSGLVGREMTVRINVVDLDLEDHIAVTVDTSATSGAVFNSSESIYKWTPKQKGVYSVKIKANDGKGESEKMMTIDVATPPSHVLGRYIFYNNSAWDQTMIPEENPDVRAIAPNKQALLPGQNTDVQNYINYSKGINGILIEMDNLPEGVTVSDFDFKMGNITAPSTWLAAPKPSSFSINRKLGSTNAFQISLIWADNAIPNTKWLQVRIKKDRAGLQKDDVFYFGNAIGEDGSPQCWNAGFCYANVNGIDETGTMNNLHAPATIDDPRDYNRDKKVDAADLKFLRANKTTSTTALRFFTAPPET